MGQSGIWGKSLLNTRPSCIWGYFLLHSGINQYLGHCLTQYPTSSVLGLSIPDQATNALFFSPFRGWLVIFVAICILVECTCSINDPRMSTLVISLYLCAFSYVISVP